MSEFNTVAQIEKELDKLSHQIGGAFGDLHNVNKSLEYQNKPEENRNPVYDAMLAIRKVTVESTENRKEQIEERIRNLILKEQELQAQVEILKAKKAS